MRKELEGINDLLECPYIQILMHGPDDEAEHLDPINLEMVGDTAADILQLLRSNPQEVAEEVAEANLWLLVMLDRAHMLLHEVVEDYTNMRILALQAANALPPSEQKATILRRIQAMRGVEADTNHN